MSGVIAIRILYRNGSFIKHFYLYRLMKKVNRVFGRVLSEKQPTSWTATISKFPLQRTQENGSMGNVLTLCLYKNYLH